MKKFLTVIFAITLLYSCTRTVNTLKYYVLEFPIRSLENEYKSTVSPEVCEVLPIQISEAYSQHKIAVRKRSHELNYYHYHQWAESPDLNISRLIIKKLSADALFSRVSEHIYNESPRYQLNSIINTLEAVEGEDSLFAHISIKLELFDRDAQKVVVNKNFDRSDALEEWDINYFAFATSNILNEELTAFSKKIKIYLASEAVTKQTESK